MDHAVTRRVGRNPKLRPLMTAWAAFYTGDLAHYALLIVFTFAAGGVPAVGAATVFNVLPGGLIGPFAATLATSRQPQRHLAMGIGARVVVMAATIAAVLTGASVGAVLALVALDSVVSAGVRPLHGALVVRLADTAAEAAAANAATSSLLSASMLLGPALGGLALGLLGVAWAFAVPAALFAVGMVAALSIVVPDDESADQPVDEVTGDGYGQALWAHVSAVGGGFRAILASRPAAAAAGLFVVNITLLGMWDVAGAAVADQRLGLGQGGITTIMTFFGAGGLLGALATMSIVGRHGLSFVLAGAMVGCAVVFAAAAVITLPAPVLGLAAFVGAAGGVAYAVAPTLVQRSVDPSAMVSGAASLQSLYLMSSAAGATIAPILIGWIGLPAALLLAGAAAVGITMLAWPQLRRADVLSAQDAAKLAVIQATPMLAPLRALALEQLARAATRLTVPAGEEVIRQGDRGDRFYMIAAGLADVTVDGRRVATLGPGGWFGEISMLHDVVRSATVTAREDLDLVIVGRGDFQGALASTTGAARRIGGLANARLATTPVEDRLVELDRDEALNGRSLTELLASQPPMAQIGAGAVNEVADAARVLGAPDGALIIREGDYGDTYYVILRGGAEVLEGQDVVRSLRPGDGFGEYAIMRDIPRTASVRALGDTTLVAADRETFQRARQSGC